MKIYWNGRLRPARDVQISPINSGLFYGENIFEAVPVYSGSAMFLREHLARLRKGCDFLMWPALRAGEFTKAIRLFSREGECGKNFMIRFNLVQELEEQINPRTFLKKAPVMFASARPLRHDPDSVSLPKGKVGISPWTAADERTLPNRFKISFYITTRSVFRAHPEWAEMLRLNAKGEVVDGGVSTPLWFDGKKVWVPPLRLGGLESVTRGKIIKLCKGSGIKLIEKSWRVRDLMKKGELVFVGSGIGVMSPVSLNNRKINKNQDFARFLWQRYRDWTRSFTP